eukprot:TRINITY_DN9021_c0_g1_i3.p1 TRINITY_DN9021_c0_g1~~TRINITY_DN9021_c0_g1_i3.p1  ORF type:complete len:231 (-),score=-3.32 TRINITY_DN9021_c0_g1_i3:138-830(-)
MLSGFFTLDNQRLDGKFHNLMRMTALQFLVSIGIFVFISVTPSLRLVDYIMIIICHICTKLMQILIPMIMYRTQSSIVDKCSALSKATCQIYCGILFHAVFFIVKVCTKANEGCSIYAFVALMLQSIDAYVARRVSTFALRISRNNPRPESDLKRAIPFLVKGAKVETNDEKMTSWLPRLMEEVEVGRVLRSTSSKGARLRVPIEEIIYTRNEVNGEQMGERQCLRFHQQ